MIDLHLSNNQLELAGAVCVAALAALSFFKYAFGGVKKQIGRLSLHAKILLLFCIVDSIIVCGTKTNEPPRSAGAPITGKAAKMAAIPVGDAVFPVRGDGTFWSVSPEDIVRGYRVESIATNEAPFAEMTSNAVEYAKWSLRGGRETGGIMELWNYGIM